MFIEIKIHGQNADGTPKMRQFLISGEYHTYLADKFVTQ
jgi:hypothetical protein